MYWDFVTNLVGFFVRSVASLCNPAHIGRKLHLRLLDLFPLVFASATAKSTNVSSTLTMASIPTDVSAHTSVTTDSPAAVSGLSKILSRLSGMKLVFQDPSKLMC